ncbi:hypothetical protein [Staphylococcus aureus]
MPTTFGGEPLIKTYNISIN